MKISPSILAAELISLKGILQHMDPAVVDFIHLDVMDGHFVPQLSYGEKLSAEVKAACTIPLDVHLMVTAPQDEIPKYFALAPHNITFHLEATNFPIRLAQHIREAGIKAGVALNPGTPAGALDSILDYIDLILIMTVEPGFYGQKFIDSCLAKIQKVREMTHGRNILLQVDGGVNANNIARLAQCGVEICVAGAAGFQGGNVNQNVTTLKTAAAGSAG